MSRTSGEGRSAAEKASHLVITPESLRDEARRLRAEEAEWAAKSGPVTVRFKENSNAAS